MILDASSLPTQRKRSGTVIWRQLGGTDTGDLIFVGGFNDKSIHVYGTFGGATVTIKGGNVQDASQTVGLKDFAGNALTFTAGGVNSVRDNIAYLHPVITGGTGSDLTVVLFME